MSDDNAKKPPSGIRRILFSLVAFAAFFGMLELSLLGISHLVYYLKVTRYNPAPVDVSGVKPIRFITVGDSVTAGQGTAPMYSYPRQFESLLNELNPDKKFQVINHGVFAMNSSRAAYFLPKWLEVDQPDWVIVMSGCNNAWNYRNSNLSTLGTMDRSAMQQFLDRFRTYRFMRVAIKGVHTPAPGADVVAPGSDPKLVAMDVSQSVSFQVDTTSATNERQKKMFTDRSSLNQLLNHDLEMMHDSVTAVDGRMVVMSYPFQPAYFDHRDTTRAFSRERQVPMVDNFDVFQAVKRAHPEVELFSADRGHPNATGYRVVAASLYDVISREALRAGVTLAPVQDPLTHFKDVAYLRALLAELKVAAEGPRADEYSWEQVAHVAMELGDRVEARAALRKAFDRSNGAPQFYESLGNLLMQDGDWDGLRDLKLSVQGSRSDRSDIKFLLNMFPDGPGEGGWGITNGAGEGPRAGGPQ